jgi:hypothetical protein
MKLQMKSKIKKRTIHQLLCLSPVISSSSRAPIRVASIRCHPFFFFPPDVKSFDSPVLVMRWRDIIPKDVRSQHYEQILLTRQLLHN